MLLLLLSFPFLAQADSNFCYMCASDDLKSRWQLTGLPKISDQYFMTCSGSSNTNWKRESCPGACFTMMFDDPDSTAAAATNPLFVRGCHSTLMQVTSNRSTSNGGLYCEFDNSYPMADSRGTLKHIYMLMEFCSSNDCNTRKSYTEPPCTQQTSDLLNNQPIQCYECTPKQGSNCKEGKCSKKYCMRQTVKLGGAYQTTKSCSDVNLAGVDNYCLSNDVTATPGGVAVKNRYTQCYCKTKHFCNASSLPALSLAAMCLLCSLLF